MSTLRTPIVAAVIGEGGSGGALALAVADLLPLTEADHQLSPILHLLCSFALASAGDLLHGLAGSEQPPPRSPEPS